MGQQIKENKESQTLKYFDNSEFFFLSCSCFSMITHGTIPRALGMICRCLISRVLVTLDLEVGPLPPLSEFYLLKSEFPEPPSPLNSDIINGCPLNSYRSNRWKVPVLSIPELVNVQHGWLSPFKIGISDLAFNLVFLISKINFLCHTCTE